MQNLLNTRSVGQSANMVNSACDICDARDALLEHIAAEIGVIVTGDDLLGSFHEAVAGQSGLAGKAREQRLVISTAINRTGVPSDSCYSPESYTIQPG